MIQDGRQYGSTPRFTYNGKQLDKELNWQDYGMRESDAITGRFVSLDPITAKYPELTPYQYASNRPIDGIDLDGLEYLDMIKGQLQRKYEMEMKAKANAKQLEDNYLKSVVMAMAQKPQAHISQAPTYTPEQQKQKEAYRVKRLNEEGYNADGTLQPWAKLATNKTWTNFADNIALPMASYAVGEGVGKVSLELFAEKKLTFYTVQGEKDAARLLSGGDPWPTGPTRAHLGEGLYTWGSQADADAYLSIKSARLPNENLRVMKFSMTESNFNKLNKFIVPNDDELANQFLQKHSSLFGEGAPHPYNYVQRQTSLGTEHYFDKQSFKQLTYQH